MSQKRRSQHRLICIFPYIEISRPFRIRDITLFPYKWIEENKIDDKDELIELGQYFTGIPMKLYLM